MNNPHSNLIVAQEIAELTARGIISYNEARGRIAMLGFPVERAEALIAAAIDSKPYNTPIGTNHSELTSLCQLLTEEWEALLTSSHTTKDKIINHLDPIIRSIKAKTGRPMP